LMRSAADRLPEAAAARAHPAAPCRPAGRRRCLQQGVRVPHRHGARRRCQRRAGGQGHGSHGQADGDHQQVGSGRLQGHVGWPQAGRPERSFAVAGARLLLQDNSVTEPGLLLRTQMPGALTGHSTTLARPTSCARLSQVPAGLPAPYLPSAGS
jgi:hypothetical protein